MSRAGAGYRDPLTGLRQRVAELQAQDGELRRQISWLLWATTPPSVRARLASIAAEEARLGDDAEGLQAREALLEEAVLHRTRIVSSVTDALAHLRQMPAEAPRPAPFHPPGIAPSPLQLDELGLSDATRPLVGLIEQLDPRGEVALGDDAVLRATFRVGAVAYGATMLKELDPFYLSRRVWFRLAVHVPRVVPPLSITPSHLAADIGAMVGLLVDRRTGDPGFDDAFRVSMPAEAVSLVTAEVRAALLRMRGQKSLRLRSAAGLARLDWAGSPAVEVWHAAISALGALHGAAVDLGGEAGGDLGSG